MDAREYLEEYKTIGYKISNRESMIADMKEKATCFGGKSDGERVQASALADKLSGSVCGYVAIEQEVEDLKLKRKEIVDNVEKLKGVHYDFIHKHYIQDIAVKGIAAIYGMSTSWGSTTHSRALDDMQKILDAQGL